MSKGKFKLSLWRSMPMNFANVRQPWLSEVCWQSVDEGGSLKSPRLKRQRYRMKKNSLRGSGKGKKYNK